MVITLIIVAAVSYFLYTLDKEIIALRSERENYRIATEKIKKYDESRSGFKNGVNRIQEMEKKIQEAQAEMKTAQASVNSFQEKINKFDIIEVTPKEQRNEKIVYGAGQVFFSEDFSKYDEGDFVSWGPNVFVRKSQKLPPGTKLICINVSQTVPIECKVDFPPNFSFQFYWSNSSNWMPLTFTDKKGDDFTIKFGNYGIIMPGQNAVDFDEQSWNLLKVTRVGEVVKVYNNGYIIGTGKYPQYDRFVSFKLELSGNQSFTKFLGTDLGQDIDSK